MSVETLAAGRYRIERMLGHGGMALVYEAHDEELGRPVAIKLLADNLAADPEFRERFVREARAAARLSHPHVVNVYDAGEDEGRPYIVMELVEGRTLAEEVAERGKLPVAKAVDIAIQTCAGLEHAHAAGLVHRDIKPQNLLLREDGTIKIADFGIAHVGDATRLTEVGAVMGTATYLAPEQAQGEAVTAAADIYSLGAVLYQLVTGRAPYEFASLTDLMRKQNEVPIVPVRDVAPEAPEALEDVIMNCLARRPEYRPASAAELARRLAAAAPDAPTEPLPAPTGIVATEVSADVQTRRLEAQSRTPLGWRRVALAGGAVAAIMVALAIALTSGGDGESGSRVEAPARGGTPAEGARNLGDWLRENSR